MGALYNGICYETLTSAQDAFFNSSAPVLYVMGSNNNKTVSMWFEKTSGEWKIHREEFAANGTVDLHQNTVTELPDFASCDPYETFSDGITLGWHLAAVVVTAWGMTQLKRLIR